MPIYEYRCEACQHELEALQKLSDEPLVICPNCHASALRKQVSAAGFRLKGGGWYETDFKAGGKKNVAGDSGNGAENGKGDAAAKTETGAKSGAETKTATPAASTDS